MTPEETIKMLSEVIAEQRAEINLRERVNRIQDKAFAENAIRFDALHEETSAFHRENKCLRTRIKRLERDLKLAQRMAGKRGRR